GQLVFYGHIKSLTPSGGRYLLRLDPALLLEGTSADAAAAADLPSRTPRMDAFYARDESHALLTFDVPPSAFATVITKGARSTRVTVAELAQLIRGRNPEHRALLLAARVRLLGARRRRPGALAGCAVPAVTINLDRRATSYRA